MIRRSQPKPSGEVLAFIRNEAGRLQGLSDRSLRDVVEGLRESVHAKSVDRSSVVGMSIAVSREAIQRVLGYSLYDVQQRAALALINGNVAEMQTGEGKTVAAVPAAVHAGIQGKGVHVATPNAYLAERDFEQLQPVYELLGITTGYLDVESAGAPDSKERKREAYGCDVTYGPGYEFGFDYLRDQLILKQQSQAPLGSRTLQMLSGGALESTVQGGRLGTAIVDEIDNVLIDDSSSPQVLSEFQPGEAPDREAITLARQLALKLNRLEHFTETLQRGIELTDEGNREIHQRTIPIPTDVLIRPWARYVEAALRAEYLFLRDVHYVVSEERVCIVEQSTGRIFQDRSWQAGLHQAVEAKEGLPIRPESLPFAQITRQRFYRLYDQLCGMTGTASNCRSEFEAIYKLDVVEIPLRLPSQRRVLPLQVFERSEEKWDSIAHSVQRLHEEGRPVLVGTRTIVESQWIASILSERGVEYELLNGKQDADEAEVIGQAGQTGKVTIATNLAGRGTDIKLDLDARNRGGLHVIVTECHASQRVDRQLIGRCARQGDPGSCQFFVSAEDWLFQKYAPWFAKTLRWVSRRKLSISDLPRKIVKIQNTIERQQFASRLQLLQKTEEQHRVLSNA